MTSLAAGHPHDRSSQSVSLSSSKPGLSSRIRASKVSSGAAKEGTGGQLCSKHGQARMLGCVGGSGLRNGAHQLLLTPSLVTLTLAKVLLSCLRLGGMDVNSTSFFPDLPALPAGESDPAGVKFKGTLRGWVLSSARVQQEQRPASSPQCRY